MRIQQLLMATLVGTFLPGCASTEKRNAEIALAEQKLDEFAPQLKQLHVGMSRAEIEMTIQPYKKGGTINISGFMDSNYWLSPEVIIWLHYHTGSSSQEGGEWAADSLRATNGEAQVLIKTSSGREKWVDLPIRIGSSPH